MNYISNDLLISRGGYYTAVITPGLRLVSLNTIYCYYNNLWLYIDSKDPENQLSWLVQILQNSENINEKVIIIGHIDPKSCLAGFIQNYYKIINRYESTIVGQYFGHSHYDFIEMFYDLDSTGEPLKRATGVSFIAPSVSSFQESDVFFYASNPAYTIYTLDGVYEGSSFNPLSFTTMYLDLNDANQRNVTEWKVEYDTKSEYGLDSLLPSDFDSLINRMLSDLYSPLTEKYIK